MEFLEPFVAVLVIFRESLKLLAKNRKLTAITLTVSILLSSLSFLILYFCCKTMSRNMIPIEFFMPIPGSSDDTINFATILIIFDEYFKIIVAFEVFVLAKSIISIYSSIATILLSVSSYNGRTITLSFKNLAKLTVQARRRQYKTNLQISLRVIGCIFVVLFVASPSMMFSGNSLGEMLWTANLVGISAACILFLYLSVAWVLGSVISVIEENCYGIEAMKKAGRLIEGKRIQGFILNIMFNFSLLAVVGFGILRDHKWLVDNLLIFGLFIVIFSCLLRFFYFVAYTVLYFKCKKSHGEEIEFPGGIVGYSKISAC
ncbi:hypothetical protein ACH5RR_003774 [Cinchona calisaya]|uniref:Protein RFT1 homolog n=1 Tax=Cinchona calisaya TaxID=153742 RepID=A0ABD3AVR1_9GENT